MKLLRTLVLFDQGNFCRSTGWTEIHDSMAKAILAIDHPAGSGALTIRRKTKQPNSNQWNRNGVGYLKLRFLEQMTEIQGWHPEGTVDLERKHTTPEIQLYPSFEKYQEPITSSFGGFDFVTTTSDGERVGIEWETGNISSSHRSLNKLVIALSSGFLQVGILVVPSRSLYEHLTDRIGNINELSAYLSFWESQKMMVKQGVLAIAVVEQDALSDALSLPYLKVGKDGRSKKNRSKI